MTSAELELLEPDTAGQPHVLYRVYNASRRLLYVGITLNPDARFTQHRVDKPWWTEVATIKLQHFANRADVEEAEVEAIKLERPKFNIVHRFREPVLPRSLQTHRGFRITDSLWWDFVWVAKRRDDRISDVLRDAVEAYLRRNRQILTETPRPEGWTSKSESTRRRLDEAEKREAQ